MRTRLSYANVASTLALILAVGGGGVAYAASLGKNTVGSKQVINNSLKAKDLGTGSVTSDEIADGTIGQGDLGAGSVGSGAIADGSIGHSDLTSGAIGVVRGYAWINDGGTTLGVSTPLTNSYVYNSAGGQVTVTRSATGVYNVNFDGLDFSPGNVQVTSYGGSANYCKVSSWGGSNANIHCFAPGGAAADNTFSLAVIE